MSRRSTTKARTSREAEGDSGGIYVCRSRSCRSGIGTQRKRPRGAWAAWIGACTPEVVRFMGRPPTDPFTDLERNRWSLT